MLCLTELKLHKNSRNCWNITEFSTFQNVIQKYFNREMKHKKMLSKIHNFTHKK